MTLSAIYRRYTPYNGEWANKRWPKQLQIIGRNNYTTDSDSQGQCHIGLPWVRSLDM